MKSLKNTKYDESGIAQEGRWIWTDEYITFKIDFNNYAHCLQMYSTILGFGPYSLHQSRFKFYWPMCRETSHPEKNKFVFRSALSICSAFPKEKLVNDA